MIELPAMLWIALGFTISELLLYKALRITIWEIILGLVLGGILWGVDKLWHPRWMHGRTEEEVNEALKKDPFYRALREGVKRG